MPKNLLISGIVFSQALDVVDVIDPFNHATLVHFHAGDDLFGDYKKVKNSGI